MLHSQVTFILFSMNTFRKKNKIKKLNQSNSKQVWFVGYSLYLAKEHFAIYVLTNYFYSFWNVLCKILCTIQGGRKQILDGYAELNSKKNNLWKNLEEIPLFII